MMKAADRLYGNETPQPPNGGADKAGGRKIAAAKSADRLYGKDQSQTGQIAAEKGIPVMFTKTKPPPITTSSFTLPGGMKVDKVRFGNFASILFQAQQKIGTNPGQVVTEIREMGQKLLDLHMEEVRLAHIEFNKPYIERWEKVRAGWRQAFYDDPEIGKNRRGTTVARATALLEAYGKDAGAHRLDAFRDVMSQTGAGDHAEVLRFVNWVAGKMKK
jgi:hypothetical protein